MTNNNENNDDFIEPEIGAPEEHARPGMVGNLAEAWRTRPLFKFTVLLVAVFAVGVAGINFFGGSNGAGDVSAHLSTPPNLKEAPGGAVSPYMRQQTELANKERSEQAMANGGSALPTPIGQTTDVGNFGGTDKKDDPLNELRVETETLKKQIQQQQVVQAQQQQAQLHQQQQPQQPEQFDNTLAEAMQRQMQQMLESWTPKGIKEVAVKTDESKGGNDSNAAQAAAAGGQQAASASSASSTPAPKLIVNAGTVSYAQLLTEANSDVPGPIMAQIVSGPLSGARAIGSFQVATGYEKYLVLRFSIADKKGKDYQINAIALDPDTTLGGMATEVDERYFTRVVLPAAAGFLQGMGQALGQGNTSVTTNGSTSISQQTSNGYKQGIYNGMGEAAQTMGQFFQEQANLTKPLVRVASGTPMGLFFVSSVMEPSANGATQTQNGNMNGYNNNGIYPNNGYNGNNNGYNNAGYNGNGTGYPGTTVNGYGSVNSQNSATPYPNYANPGAGYNHSGGNVSTASPYAGYNSGASYSGYGQ